MLLMPLKTSCETIAKYYLPAIRSIIAKKLVEQYRLSQTQVAEKLGTTQAAVSQYLSSRRGVKTTKEIEEDPMLKKAITQVIEKIAKNEDPDILSTQLCHLCNLIRERKRR